MRATKLCNFPQSTNQSAQPIAQCFLNSFGNDLFYILNQHTIQVINFTNGASNETQEFEQKFRPLIAYDKSSEYSEPYFWFEDGHYGQFHNGSLIMGPNQISSNKIIVNNEFIISGDEKSGAVTFHNPSGSFTVNKPDFFSFKKFVGNDGVMSIAANSNYVFILTKNAKLIIYRISDQQKLTSSTLCGEKLEFGLIKCDEENFYVLFKSRSVSEFQGSKYNQNQNQILFNIKHQNLKYFDISQDQIVLVSDDSVTIHNKETGELQSNCILPFDLESNQRKITPEVAFINSNGSVYISTKSEIYISRPPLPLENHSLFIHAEKSEKGTEFDLLKAAIEFSRIFSSSWQKFDSNLKTTSDPSEFAYELISKHFDEEYETIESPPSELIITQLNEIINILSINDSIFNHQQEDQENRKVFDEFYCSVCSEIVFSYSYFSRCVYLLIMYLTYKQQTSKYAKQLRKLSILVNIYTQLSILFKAKLPLQLFDCFSPEHQESTETFTQIVGNQIVRLLDLETTMKRLVEYKLYDTAIQFGAVSTFPLSYTGLALLKRGKHDEAVSFYIQNSQFLLKDHELAALVFESLRQARRDDLIIRIGYIDSTTNAAILFRAFITLKDYDSAFNCILTTKDERIKCDMLRVFIRIMKENKLHVKLLKSYPLNSMMSLFVNSLCTYSEETLLLAIVFFRVIRSRYQATQALYEYSRCLLKTPTKERLGKALTSLNLVLYQLDQQHDDISIRDMRSYVELTEKKVRRIISRTKCCLLLDESNPKDKKMEISNSKELSFGELLAVAADRNIEIFKSSLYSATEEELLNLVPVLFEKSLKTPISLSLNQMLSFNKNSKNPFIVEKLFTLYFHHNYERNLIPPAFVIGRFCDINVTRMFIVLAKQIYFNQKVIFDILMFLKNRPNLQKLKYLIPLMKKIGLPDQLIQQFFE